MPGQQVSEDRYVSLVRTLNLLEGSYSSLDTRKAEMLLAESLDAFCNRRGCPEPLDSDIDMRLEGVISRLDPENLVI